MGVTEHESTRAPTAPEIGGMPILEVCAIDRDRLRQSIYRRVFGEADPIKIGRFTVLERVGSGGMGVVYKAYDTRLDRKIAVKVIHIGGAAAGARRAVITEARALARLSHPNVVHVYEVGEGRDGELFIAMEFVEGLTLRQWLARATRDWREVVGACLQAGEGLAAAHTAGLIHRDFKPDNVIVGAGRVRVLDFGLAHVGALELDAEIGPALRDEARALQATTARGRGIVGTPAYMAPEQIAAGTIGPASDQFAFCVTLFEALYGVRPFEGATLAELAVAIENGAITVPGQRRGVPKRLHRALLQGLAARPERRHASMQLLLGELRSALRGQRVLRVVALAGFALAVPATVLLANRPVAAIPAADDTGARDEVVMLRAEAELATDPSAAVATLGELSPSAPHWDGRARMVAEQAAAFGIAKTELRLVGTLEPLALAGTRVFAFDTTLHALVVVDADTGAVRQLVSDMPAPPTFGGLSVSGRPSLRTSPDGRWALLNGDESAQLVDVDTGKLIQLPRITRASAFSGDNSRLVIEGEDGTRVVELASGAPLLELPGPMGYGLTLALDEHGTRLASDADGEVAIHDVGGAEPRRIGTNAAAVFRFVGGAGALVTAPESGGLELSLGTDVPPRSLGSSETRHLELATVDDDRWIASVTADDGVHVRELATDELLTFEPGHELRASPDDTRLAWLREDGRAHVLEITSRAEWTLGVDAPIVAISFAPSGDVLTLTADRRVRRWTLPAQPAALRGHTESIGDVVFAPSGDALFSAAQDRTLRRWDLARGESQVLATVEGHIVDLAISRDGRFLASDTSGGTLELRRSSDGELLLQQPGRHHGVMFAGDGLYVADEGGIVRIDPESGARTTIVDEDARCRALALDGSATRLAASCGEDPFAPALHVWELPSGRPVLEERTRHWMRVELLDRDHVLGGGYTEPPLLLDLRDGSQRVLGDGARASDFDVAGDEAVVATMAGGLELHHPTSDSRAALPISTAGRIAPIAELSSDARLLAYSLDRRTIALREREVPRAADELRAWVLEHRIARTEVR